MCLWKGPDDREDLARVFLVLVRSHFGKRSLAVPGTAPSHPPRNWLISSPARPSREEGLAPGFQPVSCVREVVTGVGVKGPRSPWGSSQGGMALGSPQALPQLPEQNLVVCRPPLRFPPLAVAQFFSEQGIGPKVMQGSP